MKKYLVLTVVLLMLVGLTISSQNSASAGSRKKVSQAPLVVLESSDTPVNQGSSARAITVSAADARLLYFGNRVAGSLAVGDTESSRSTELNSLTEAENFDAVAVDPKGNIYFADSGSNQVRVVSPAGATLRVLPIAQPYALSVLSNGNLVVASNAGMDLLHLYSPSGSRLLSFGDMRLFDDKNYKQNRFLNRGRIAIGPSDTIYYISKNAPRPVVQKYSSDGSFLSEFAISGDAVDVQLGFEETFLRGKQPNVVGGVAIITSATVDPSTGHLWIGLHGTSKTGVVYEYNSDGVKLHEYAFLLKKETRRTGVVTGVADLVVRNSQIYLLTPAGLIHRFSLRDTVSALPRGGKRPGLGFAANLISFFSSRPVSPASPLDEEAPCPEAQAVSCTANCPVGSVDCGSQARSALSPHIIITGSNCDNTPKPNKPNSCKLTVSWCDPATHATGTTGVDEIVCPPPADDDCGGVCFFEYICFDGVCTNCSPILVDVSGRGFRLTNAADGIDFDFNRDLRQERISWTASDSDNAWLVLDRNGNGLIDDGTELFGNITPQPVSANPNGFIALAEYDKVENGGNGDGRVDRRDAIFASLRLWQDLNHNGISEPSELHPPLSLGVKGFDLDFRASRRVDEFGNQFRYRANVIGTRKGSVNKVAWDVYLRKN